MNVAIETTSLTRDFGKFRAVNELSLRVEAGRFYGFLGPNGAGKSTTIKMLTGLLAPSGGAMRILGEEVGDPKRALAVKQRIGVVPENLALFDNLTAREYLTFIGRMYLLPRDTVRTRAEELLAMMDLAHEEKKLTLEFSHGMKKKLVPRRRADSESRFVVPRRTVRGRGRGGVARVARHAQAMRRARRDGFSHVARPGNRRETLHGRRHHRAGQTGASGHDGGVAARRLLAGGQIHLGRRQRRTRGAKIELAGMNWEQLKTILWLRWRLMCNQWRRGGGLGAVVAVLVSSGAFVLAAVCFISGLAGGIFGLREA